MRFKIKPGFRPEHQMNSWLHSRLKQSPYSYVKTVPHLLNVGITGNDEHEADLAAWQLVKDYNAAVLPPPKDFSLAEQKANF